MLPLLGSFMPKNTRKKKTSENKVEAVESNDMYLSYNFPYNCRDSTERPIKKFSLRTENNYRKQEAKPKRKGEMSNKVSNFSDLIHRVAASCLLHPLAPHRHNAAGGKQSGDDDENEHDDNYDHDYDDTSDHENDKETERMSVWNEDWKHERKAKLERVRETEMLILEVFESVSEMKRAYVSLQEAHSPLDPEKVRIADVAVVAELRRISVLKERFRRNNISYGGGNGGGVMRSCYSGGGMLREVVAPYEAAVEELKREVKMRENQVLHLEEKLRNFTTSSSNVNHHHHGKKGKSANSHHHHHQSRRRVSCSSSHFLGAPTQDIFEATMSQVKETSKAFTSVLLSLMRSARWDIAAAVRSIEVAFTTVDSASITTTTVTSGNHAKYALESYISRKIFQGFDHETFYMDGSLSSILHPDQFRKDCFAQYCDMKSMAPMELLGVLPTCHFGKFCSRKYLSILHPKMEESLFGNLDQQEHVLAGTHPRSDFYGEFLGLAKAVWLLHLLAFSLEPSPSLFEASRGAEFHQEYMESVVKVPNGRVAAGQTVGFPVTPGFKLSNGSVIKSRVYLVVPRT